MQKLQGAYTPQKQSLVDNALAEAQGVLAQKQEMDTLFASGSVLYIEYRDYKSFKNNYNTERHQAGIVIADAETGAFLDIPGR